MRRFPKLRRMFSRCSPKRHETLAWLALLRFCSLCSRPLVFSVSSWYLLKFIVVSCNFFAWCFFVALLWPTSSKKLISGCRDTVDRNQSFRYSIVNRWYLSGWLRYATVWRPHTSDLGSGLARHTWTPTCVHVVPVSGYTVGMLYLGTCWSNQRRRKEGRQGKPSLFGKVLLSPSSTTQIECFLESNPVSGTSPFWSSLFIFLCTFFPFSIRFCCSFHFTLHFLFPFTSRFSFHVSCRCLFLHFPCGGSTRDAFTQQIPALPDHHFSLLFTFTFVSSYLSTYKNPFYLSTFYLSAFARVYLFTFASSTNCVFPENVFSH